MSRYVWDLESTGLDIKIIDTIWIIVIYNLETKQLSKFSNYHESCNPLEDIITIFDQAEELIGHNILMYDIPVMEQVLGWIPNPKTKLTDTLILSQVNNYIRTSTLGRHSVEAWGNYFGIQKPEQEVWDVWTDDLIIRCTEDTKISVKIYEKVMQEYNSRVDRYPLYSEGIKDEHVIAQFSAEQVKHGWLFDIEEAHRLSDEIAAEMDIVAKQVEPMLGYKIDLKDQGEEKKPLFRKDGMYKVWITNWFGLDEDDARTKMTVEGPFTRITFTPAELGNLEIVKNWLRSVGWIPDEWNYKKDPITKQKMRDENRQLIKTSPKITDTSLENITDPRGKLVVKWLTMRSRFGIIKGWINECESGDGRVRCRPRTIGTPTFRMTHKGVVNIPSKGLYGKECRKLFIADEGRTIVGCDSKGNQLRGLAHYINNPEFTKSVVEGNSEDGTDPHSRNKQAIALPSVGRAEAKQILYALIFGGGDDKLASYATYHGDTATGIHIRDSLMVGIPGFAELNDKITNQYKESKKKNRQGFVLGLDGRRVYIDSVHKALNYQLQSFEAITVKASVAKAYLMWLKSKLDVWPLTIMHDEVQLSVANKDVDAVIKILIYAFIEAPKKYGVMIHEGDVHVGQNWSESH